MSRDQEATERMPAPLARRPPVASRGFAERLALFVIGVDRDHAADLLAGLGDAPRKQALAFAQSAAAWDSATRQGRMAVAFAAHPLAGERLKTLLSKASPPMRLALFRRLPPWQQSMFPSLEGLPDPAVSPAMAEVAERLIREATR